MLWVYLFTNILAFFAIMIELFFVGSELGMFLYPDLNKILADAGVSRLTRILLFTVFSITFAPAMILWYIFVGIIAVITFIRIWSWRRV